MKIEQDKLTALLRSVLHLKDDYIGCKACFEALDRYIDLHLAGKDAARALPLVEAHLENCADCREEFEVLLEILKTYPQ